MRRILRIAGGALVLLLLAGAVYVVPTVWFIPWRLEDLYNRAFIELGAERPMTLSRLRILEPYGLDFHSDELDDFSVVFAEASAARIDGYLDMLERFPRSDVSEEDRISRDIFAWYLEILQKGRPFLFYDYPLNQFSGRHTGLPDFMVNIHQINDSDDARDYVARLQGFETALAQTIAGLEYRAEHGVVPPAFVLAHVEREIAELLETPIEEHILYTHLAGRLDELSELGESQRSLLLESGRAALETRVYPGYRQLALAVKALSERATDDAGVWKLPNGAAYYAQRLAFHTTTDLAADEIHEMGLAEVARIRSEMRAILEAEGLPGEDPGATLAALGTEQRFLYPDTDAGREAILADFQGIIDELHPRLPEYFGILPRAQVRVERVPAFREVGAAGAYYRGPPFDGSRPGIFFANLRNVAEIQRFGMRTLTYHEAIPGHHLQVAIAREQTDAPFFRRIVSFTAFTEGWALYAERLAYEEGFHPTPYDRLGALQAERFRAVRLVVDTGLHAQRWSRERAIEYMRRITGNPEGDVVAEIERYIVNPGQACAYKVGQLRLLALRDRAREALGERFDYRAFHDVVLGGGPMPLTLLEHVVDDWIARQTL